MKFKINLPEWIPPELLKDALVIGFVLSVWNYGVDVLLFWLKIPAAATAFNDLTVGVLGGLCAADRGNKFQEHPVNLLNSFIHLLYSLRRIFE